MKKTKNIQLENGYLQVLSIEAIKQGMTCKTYIEELLINHVNKLIKENPDGWWYDIQKLNKTKKNEMDKQIL